MLFKQVYITDLTLIYIYGGIGEVMVSGTENRISCLYSLQNNALWKDINLFLLLPLSYR